MIPAYAERMSYLDHVHVVRTYSRFMPGRTVMRSMFACPGCGTQRELLPVNETLRCTADGCGLHLRADEAYLHVWHPMNLGRPVVAEPALQAAE